MNTGQRVIVALLAIVAVLLAIDLGPTGSGSAEAQNVGGGDPYVVVRLPNDATRYYRVWSDGQIDYWQKGAEGCDFSFVRVVVSAANHPFDVVDAESSLNGVIVRYADGRVDHVSRISPPITRCTLAGQGSDPFCLGDVDRSGDTNFDDLLLVLNDWGVCE